VIETANQLDPRENPFAFQHAFVVDAILVRHQLSAQIVVRAPDDLGAIGPQSEFGEIHIGFAFG